VTLFPRTLAISEDKCGHHKWECSWYGVSRGHGGQGCCSVPHKAQDASTESNQCPQCQGKTPPPVEWALTLCQVTCCCCLVWDSCVTGVALRHLVPSPSTAHASVSWAVATMGIFNNRHGFLLSSEDRSLRSRCGQGCFFPDHYCLKCLVVGIKIPLSWPGGQASRRRTFRLQ
jgi:hypothetical protein